MIHPECRNFIFCKNTEIKKGQALGLPLFSCFRVSFFHQALRLFDFFLISLKEFSLA